MRTTGGMLGASGYGIPGFVGPFYFGGFHGY
jgi:hypothetical protein